MGGRDVFFRGCWSAGLWQIVISHSASPKSFVVGGRVGGGVLVCAGPHVTHLEYRDVPRRNLARSLQQRLALAL